MTLAVGRAWWMGSDEGWNGDTGGEMVVAWAEARTASRVVLVVEYEGTNYAGFQFQADRRTIQGELEDAIWHMTGERQRVVGASRTDAGVHAANQVVCFRTSSSLPLNKFVGGLNYHLPRDIVVKQAYRPAEEFDVQRSAISRQYEYYILNRRTRSPLRERFSYLVREQVDADMMRKAAGVLVGEHDLASFTSGDLRGVKSTVRRVWHADVRRDGVEVIFTMVANSFMPHQVRNTVGALLSVGMGKIGVEGFRNIMDRRRPGQAGPKVPARGLHLVQINYPHAFEEDSDENL